MYKLCGLPILPVERVRTVVQYEHKQNKSRSLILSRITIFRK